MLNHIVLVGRLTKDPEVNKTDSNKNYSRITLAVPRSFKNINGEYETDFIDCLLWDSVAKSTSEYCHKGDVVGVKGRIQSEVVEKDGVKKYYINVIAERVTFLPNNSTKKDDE